MRKIAVLNQKGGVGKTTSVVNIAAALATLGKKVLAIDMDPQAHLTIHLGLDPDTIEAGSYKILTKDSSLDNELVEARKNLWLLPANINLVGAEQELVSIVGRETILREALEPFKDKFDYVVIDCAPSLGLLTLNALAAADEVLIPLQPHFLALQGLGKLLQTVELVNKRINPDLKVKGVLLCMFDTRASLPNEVKADIAQFLDAARGTDCAWADARILPIHIRRNIKLAEAPSYGQTIFEYEENCNGAEDYANVGRLVDNNYSNPPLTNIEEAPQTEEQIAPQVQVEAEIQVEQQPEVIEPEPVLSHDPEQELIAEASPEPDPQQQPKPPTIGIKEFTLGTSNPSVDTKPLHPEAANTGQETPSPEPKPERQENNPYTV
jgi:chromosome partitioning protein